MMRIFVSAAVVVGVSGCASISERFGIGRSASAPVAAPATVAPGAEAPTLAPETAAPPPPPSAVTAAALDTTTPEQRAAATAAPDAPRKSLGTTIVSLGSPTEAGLWLKTPLVSTEQQGRVTNPRNGKSSLVTLIPIDGPDTAGSRMSLAAMRLIEVSLTDLSEVEVSLAG